MHKFNYCDVIGCYRKACWLLIAGEDTDSGDALCDIHWELLDRKDPQSARRYTRLSNLLAEGMGLAGGVPLENPQNCRCSALDRNKRDDQDGSQPPSDEPSGIPTEHQAR